MKPQNLEDPIAVVGYSLKFPQDGDTPQSFWDMLYEGRCASTDFPPDRLNVDAWYDSESAGARMLPLRGGHFLKEDLGLFDTNFFNITPAEAKAMDPQHRIMLETSYRALENAGIPLHKCYGSSTSVYTATFTNDYQATVAADLETLPKYAATGLSASMLANRVSWFYDFKGASMNLDSACSSSLSALHLACEDLRNGTSNMSLVGGSNLLFNPQFMLILTNMGFLSPDSRCWSFDERANGYARGEGIGVVVLKRLSTALKDGDTIRAVIRATGLNQDGRTTGGITQPSGEAQKQLIESVFERSGIDRSTVGYFEAHGTGTALGDPIETRAIGESFRDFRKDDEPLIVGSVKSNIGHLEGGSGVAGLIKTIMILEKGIIPPVASLTKVNPRIDTKYLRIRFPTEPLPWPGGGLRRACVNSFGFGGSNATLIVDDALHFLEEHGLTGHHRTIDLRDTPPRIHQKANGLFNGLTNGHTIGPTNGHTNGLTNGTSHYSPEIDRSKVGSAKRYSALTNGNNHFFADGNSSHRQQLTTPKVCVWSAADEVGIKNFISIYGRFFKQRAVDGNIPPLDDLTYTLAARRTAHPWRSYMVVSSEDELRSIAQSSSKPVRVPVDPRSVAFVFTGQGAAYPKMGYELLGFPRFGETISRLDNLLNELGCSWSLRDLLVDPDASISHPEYSQTATTAVQIAIVELLRSFGIVPSAVIGHSSGEVAAAYCAGAIGEAEAMAIAYHRGRLAATIPKRLSAPESMLAVGLGEDSIRPFFIRLKSAVGEVKVTIACLNSPASVTLSGDETQLDLLDQWLKEEKHFARKLPVSVAYHSASMKAIEVEYLESLSILTAKKELNHTTPMVSSVTGNIISPNSLRDPGYWVTNLVSQVKFSPALSLLTFQSGRPRRKHLGRNVQTLSGIKDFMEIGPHSTLQGPIRDVLKSMKAQSRLTYVPTLRRSRDAARSILESAAHMWTLGYPVDLLKASGIDEHSRAVLTDLPEYAFNHTKRYWSEDRVSADMRFRKYPPHELLGTWIPSSTPLEGRWRSFLDAERLPWVRDHHISGECVMPGAGMIAMAIEATRQLCPADKHITKFHLSDIQFLNALRVPDGTDGTEMQLSLSASTQVRSANSEAYFFRLMSLDSEWTEHCRGTIRVEFDEPLAEDKHQNASEDMYLIRDACREEADVEQLYSSSADNGVDYGPLFQVLNDVHYNGQKRGQAAATLCTQMDAVNNPGKRSYTIHPAVLDGLFQLVFSALYNGGTVDFPAMVPTSVRSLSIHLGTSTSTEISKMEASCNSRFSGYRGTTSDVVATASDDSKALIIMEGYQSTFVSANMPTFQQQAAERQLLSHMHWQPDLAMMSSDKIKEMCETSSDSSLAVYLRTLSHKNPTMKILEISGAAEVDNIPCADALSSNGIPRWSQYAFAQGTTEATESTKNSLKTLHTSVDFIPLDIYGDVSKQGFEAEYYDLIIAPHVLNETENESSTLRNLRQLLNESGRLVLSISFKHDILGELTDAGFGIESVFRLTQPDKACEEDIVIARAATLQNGHSSPTTDLTIIIDQSAETQRFFAQSLQSEFQSQGLCKQISILDITTFASSPQSASQIEGPCISLLEYATPFWSRPSSTQFQAFKNLLAQKSELLWVVKSTEEAAETEFHAVDGLARVLRSEDPKRRIVRLKLDSSQDKQEKAAGTVSRVLQKMLTLPIQEMEPEYEERDRLLYINRVVQAPEMNKMMSNSLSSKREQEIVLGSGVELQARLENPGTANVIRLQEAPVVDEPLERDEVIVEVHAVGLTRRDYLIATGQFNDTRIFSECSGIVKCIGSNSKFHPGDRVMVATTNACATLLRCKESQVVAIPDGLSVADAAGLPISALAAFWSLTRTGELSEDSVVLVHHAASSLGQLCIQVAGSAGAKVIATAGTEEKREFLRKTYNIPSELVVSSKDPDLSRTILRALDGGRVDIAVTFMPPDVTDSSKVLSSFGHLIDLGLSGEATADATNYSLPKCVSKSAVEIVEMFNQRPKMVQKAFTEMLPLIQNGTIKPTTPQHVFAAAEIDKALEWFRSGENYGKVVVDLSPGQKVSAVVSNEPSSRFDPNATYVISGGFGGIGRTICRWIAERGARNLLILSRSGAKSDSSKALVKELEALGVRVEAPCCDITQHNSLQRVLDTVKQSMPPIKGCIQCSMVLRDAIFENMTHDDYITATQPKTAATWNLHTLLPSELSFFIILSSIVGVLGAHSQANYAAGNSYQDALARYRVSRGEKAISIDLGMMVTDGVVAETEGMLDSLRRLGWFMEIKMDDFLALLDYYCNPDLPLLRPDEAQIIVGIETPKGMEEKGIEPPEWVMRPLFKHSHLLGSSGKDAGSTAGGKKADYQSMLRSCSSPEEAAEHVTEWLLEKLSQVLGIAVSDLDARRPLHTHGINSLYAVEMRNWFDKHIGADINVFEILGNISIADLSRKAAEKSRFFSSRSE